MLSYLLPESQRQAGLASERRGPLISRGLWFNVVSSSPESLSVAPFLT